jgi:hypothetical protein
MDKYSELQKIVSDHINSDAEINQPQIPEKYKNA